jgi:hypothetical protein
MREQNDFTGFVGYDDIQIGTSKPAHIANAPKAIRFHGLQPKCVETVLRPAYLGCDSLNQMFGTAKKSVISNVSHRPSKK